MRHHLYVVHVVRYGRYDPRRCNYKIASLRKHIDYENFTRARIVLACHPALADLTQLNLRCNRSESRMRDRCTLGRAPLRSARKSPRCANKGDKMLAVISARQIFDSRVATKPRNVCTGGTSPLLRYSQRWLVNFQERESSSGRVCRLKGRLQEHKDQGFP